MKEHANLPAFRAICFFLAAVLTASTASAKAAGPSILFDPASGEVLSQDRAGELWYPASLTKLMTAYIVFQKLKTGQLRLDQKIPVSALASAQPPSKIGIKEGGTVTVDFAIQSLLVYSANDMAYVLAEAASPTIADFADLMNAEARRLDMTGTHFVNPNGLFDPRHISTARDLALLASAVLRDFPENAHYFSQDFVAAGKRKLVNRNSLIRQMPEADGMKTGFVCNSGFNLIATATHTGRKLGAVILGASSGKHRVDLAEMLLVDGFQRKELVPHLKIHQVQNMVLGAVVPADLTSNVCRQKAPVTIARPADISGWGISFGTYDTAMKADMALRGRLLSTSGVNLRAPAGVMRMPGKTGYAAVVWQLEQSASLSACSQYRAEQAPCDVMSPDSFSQIAALTAEPLKRIEPAGAQGSDTGRPRKKKKRRK